MQVASFQTCHNTYIPDMETDIGLYEYDDAKMYIQICLFWDLIIHSLDQNHRRKIL